MNRIARGGLAVAFIAMLIGCQQKSPDTEQTPARSAAATSKGAASTGATSKGAAPNPERNVYFGELHLHTSWSFDAYPSRTPSSIRMPRIAMPRVKPSVA